MLNQERIKLMTKMAAYEDNEGKKNMAIASYFRSDYIGFQILKSIISATIAFVILFAMYIFYDFEVFMQDIYKMDLFAFGERVLLIYVIFVAVYGVASYVVYSLRYHKARHSLKKFYSHLKQLSAMYDLENRK